MAGGVPEVFTTAHDAIFTQAGLRPGERLLLSGPMGSFYLRGGERPPAEVDLAARKAVVQLAGHARVRVSDAYLGRPTSMRSPA